MKKTPPSGALSFEETVKNAQRAGISASGIADILIRIYGFDAENARRIADAVAGEKQFPV